MLLSALGLGLAALALGGVGWVLAGQKSAHSKPEAPLLRVESPSAELLQLTDVFEKEFYQAALPQGGGPGIRRSDTVIRAFRDQHEKLADDPTLLPRQPLILPKLLRVVKHESGNAQALVAIILEDPGLTADVLKMANSPLYRNTREAVTDIDYAVVMLGSDGLKSLISATIMRPIFQSSDRRAKQTTNMLWEYALASAFIAQRFANKIKINDAFNAHLLTLLGCIAELIIVQTTLGLFDDQEEAPDLETIAYLNHKYRYLITQQLMVAWGLDDELISQLADLQAPNAQPLATAQALGRVLGRIRILQEHGTIESDIEGVTTKIGLDQKLVAFLLSGSDDSRAAA